MVTKGRKISVTTKDGQKVVGRSLGATQMLFRVSPRKSVSKKVLRIKKRGMVTYIPLDKLKRIPKKIRGIDKKF